MTKHTIEIEDLPEGWEPVAYRLPRVGDYTISDDGRAVSTKGMRFPLLVIQKTKPREITLVETEQDNIKHDGKWCNQHFRDGLILTQQPKYWRIKEE